MSDGREWTLRFEAPPLLLNAERAANRWVRMEHTANWRAAFYMLAKEQKIPKLEQATVTVRHTKAGRGRVPDVCACIPSVKAAIDGALVDTGILVDDGPAYLLAVTFEAPVRGQTDSLELVVLSVCGGV